MTRKALYIFVTSERPDQYLNPILHCIDNENVNKIVLIYVTGTNPSNETNGGISDKVLRNVQIAWDSLSNGKYRFFTGKLAENKGDIDLKNKIEDFENVQKIYFELLQKTITWEHMDIEYLKLKESLNNIIKNHPNSLFDVTACDKSLIGDIVSISIISKIKNINTFDLNVRPDFDEPWNTLYHNLKEIKKPNSEGRGAKYRYVNIINTPIFNECEKNILLYTFSFKASLIGIVGALLFFFYIYLREGSQSRSIIVLGIVASILGVWSAFVPFLTKKS